jgi:hypothetical protein
VYPAAVLSVLAVIVVLSVAADTGTTGEDKRLGADYPAFYAAGTIAGDGDWDGLYNATTQQEAQAGLIDSDGGFLYFAYPPPVALAYAPLAAIDYRWSYLLHTALMAAALWGVVRMARPLVPQVDRYPLATFAVMLLSYPLFRAVTGGQNTALTLLLIVAAARFEREERLVATGVMVGLMLYKPQFGIVFLGLLVFRRRWRSVAVAAAVGAAAWAVSAAVMGAAWLGDWWSEATEFARLNADLNKANLVSLPGALSHVFGGVGEAAGWVLAVAVGVGLVRVWWRRTEIGAPIVYALTGAAAILILPQPLFYEVGLLAFLALVTIGRIPNKELVAVALALATWVQPVSGSLGSLPSMLLTLLAAGWAAVVLSNSRAPGSETAIGAPG